MLRRTGPPSPSRWIAAAGWALLLISIATPASARKRGFGAGTCEGCHGETSNSTLNVTPTTAGLGEMIKLQIVLTDPDANVAGLFVETDDVEGLSVPSGESLVKLSNGATHSGPKAMSGGNVTFELNYRVPSTPGATQFGIWAVAANGNDDDSGDEEHHVALGLVYGCEPQTFYADMDRDGHGRAEPIVTACMGMPPEGFAAAPDDCNDNDPTENPSAVELCNSVDDNCNGEVDEDATPVELFPDADGDGYYSYEEWESGDSVIGCLPYPGYGDRRWDCDPNSAQAHPGAEEVCDGRVDEDCDGEVDERVRPYCGEGACQRESRGCTLEECTPGQPSAEVCNFIDDDCDGELDEGDICPDGLVCIAGACRGEDSLAGAGVGGGGLSAPPPAAGGGSNAEGSSSNASSTTASSCAMSSKVAHPIRKPGWIHWMLVGASFFALRRRRKERLERRPA